MLTTVWRGATPPIITVSSGPTGLAQLVVDPFSLKVDTHGTWCSKKATQSTTECNPTKCNPTLPRDPHLHVGLFGREMTISYPQKGSGFGLPLGSTLNEGPVLPAPDGNGAMPRGWVVATKI